MSIEVKNKIVKKWLVNNGFYNIQETSNHYFIRADSINVRMLVIVHDKFELNVEEVKKFASSNNRQAWVAKVEEEDHRIKWEIIK
nr:hypothetical protein [uncultured Pedobacter sp.]